MATWMTTNSLVSLDSRARGVGKFGWALKANEKT